MKDIISSFDTVDKTFNFSYGNKVIRSDFSNLSDFESAVFNEAEVQGWTTIDLTPEVIKDFYLPKDAKKVKALKAPKSNRVYITFSRFDGSTYYRRGELADNKIILSVDNKKSFIDFSTISINDSDISFRR